MDDSQMILSVTQINEYIRTLIDSDDFLSAVAVRGEISNLTLHRTGHIYFTLKDAQGVIKSVMFRAQASRLRFVLKEGMRVVVYGRISVYSPSGQYQLYAQDIQPDGIGALYLAYEQIKNKLSSEGLFDSSRKKPIVRIPSRIGIITSPTGAAIHDMINVLTRRFPSVEIVLYPALVQGEGAHKTLIAGIEYFNAHEDVDTIIIGRGGGSMEDLWEFNDVSLAYVIAGSHIPVISAVGHESDFTICDFVADLRAPTPSAAAELAVPDASVLRTTLTKSLTNAETLIVSRIERYRERIQALASSGVLVSREKLLDTYKMRIDTLSEELDLCIENILNSDKQSLCLLSAKLDAISPLNTLMRGYSIVQGENGVVSTIDEIHIGDKLDILLSNGGVSAEVREINAKGE